MDSTRRAMSWDCSSTTILPAPGRPVTSYSAFAPPGTRRGAPTADERIAGKRDEFDRPIPRPAVAGGPARPDGDLRPDGRRVLPRQAGRLRCELRAWHRLRHLDTAHC